MHSLLEGVTFPTVCNADIAETLAAQLTLPPVYSVASFAHSIKTAMIDEETSKPTAAFYSLADKLSLLPLEELWYATDSDDNTEFSAGVSDIIEDSLPESVANCSRAGGRFKLPSIKSNLIIDLITLALTIATLVSGCVSDKRTADYQQEMLSLQRQEIELLKEQPSLPPASDNREIDVESSNQDEDS